ncbi:MAG: peptidoglycan DD-metalloendopeptidase family protein [Candidatus Omnitrophica bacterium]|nr:peptidoglycan DD-metalloendopeptidase family protein [Candidatus Omnitrophota bacterium]
MKKGDSLWRIAQQYNISIDSLKRKNEIIDPAQLKAGQLLVVPDFDQDQNQGSSFVMPVKGKVVSYFGEVVDNRINKGIKIELTESQKVLSAMAGEVVFAGAINGYGQTVIIEHCDNISTVYSHLTNVEVTQGDFVAQGQSIGDVQSHPQKGSYLLHFEVRKGQTATDPLRYVRHYEQ